MLDSTASLSSTARPGKVDKKKCGRRYQSSRRHFRHERRAAALRAFTGAQLYLGGEMTPPSSMTEAAEMVGSHRGYVEAATVLLKAENLTLVNKVLDGEMPLLEAARMVKAMVSLVDAYRRASAAERVQFARTVGTEELFESVINAL
jgi:hypothetical protein